MRSAAPIGFLLHHGDLMEPASRDQALAAVREFNVEHGRLPRRHEWERATSSRPCAKTIERRWGWHELLAEAIGTEPNQVDRTWETLLDVRVQVILAALAGAREELGRWPTAIEWDRSGRRPSARTFRRHLGGWAEACRAAAGLLRHTI